MKVSIQGQKNSYHDLAKNHLFGQKTPILTRNSFLEVFQDVVSRKAQAGIIAIENSLVGPILENYDYLANHAIHITHELYVQINHQLISFPSTLLQDIKEVHAHPMALNQCQKFFRKNPHINQITHEDTAGAVMMIKNKKMEKAAAIASLNTAKDQKMKIIRKNIQDQKNNYTRFLVIKKKSPSNSKANKTTLVIKVVHKPGTLYQALGCFADQNINLVNIESRPILDKTWHYTFFIDLEANHLDSKFLQAIKEIKSHGSKVRILGSYQKGESIKS